MSLFFILRRNKNDNDKEHKPPAENANNDTGVNDGKEFKGKKRLLL